MITIRLQKLCRLFAILLIPITWAFADDSSVKVQVNFAEPMTTQFRVQTLPGHPHFVFSMYGAPGELETIKQLVQVMQDLPLGNGFDPGPAPSPHNKPIFDYLAEVGWPDVIYSGAEMQIVGGRSIFGAEHEAVLESMNRKQLFSAVQLGEWGYYFHRLSDKESWWRDVYGKDFDAFKHLMKPKGLAGYDRRPANRRECYDAVEHYFKSRCRDLLGRVISVNGHSHYEAYTGEWGARCIGLELGENIAFTQSKLAFARGASRQWQRPWSVQVSPWFNGACTSNGPLRKEGGGARGLDSGHSLSFYERMWLHCWFAGTAMVTPENSISIFFEQPSAPWKLTSHGEKASETFRFMQTHDRGVPYMPVAIVLDHLAGYNGYTDKPWGILEPTVGDRQVRDLFDHQLFPGADHIHQKPDPANPESSYLRPTPFGEIFDVQLTGASAETLSNYSVLLFAGDIEFDEELVTKISQVLQKGRTVLLTQAQRDALGNRFEQLAKFPRIEVLQPWINPATGRTTAISNARLHSLSREVCPIEVEGDPMQYQINRNEKSWVIELINNSGVVKRPDQPTVIDPNGIAKVTLRPRVAVTEARDWRSNRVFPQAKEVQVEVGPGETVFLEFLDHSPEK